MQINVTVTEVDLASVIGEHPEYDADGDYIGKTGKTLGDAVAAQLARDLMKDDSYKSLKKRVMELREEEIRAQLKPIIEAAISAPVQRTGRYGEPDGEPVSLASLIVKEVHEFLGKRVDNGYNRPATTVVQKFIAEAVEQVIRKELAESIVEEKTKVVAAVRAKAAELIATAVKEGIGR